MGDSETKEYGRPSKMFPKGGAIVFDFEKPKIEIAEISEDKDMVNLWLNRWKEAMVPH